LSDTDDSTQVLLIQNRADKSSNNNPQNRDNCTADERTDNDATPLDHRVFAFLRWLIFALLSLLRALVSSRSLARRASAAASAPSS